MTEINMDYIWQQFINASINTIAVWYLGMFIVLAIVLLIIEESDK